MSPSIKSGSLFAGLVLTFILVSPLAAAPLAYRMAVNDRFTLTTQTKIESPRGTQSGSMTMACTAKASTPRGMRWAQQISITKGSEPSKQFKLELTMAPDGSFTELSVADPKLEKIARTVQGTLPPLPNAAVSIGSTWEVERAMALPSGQVPGLPESIRVRSKYKVTAFGKSGNRDTVTFTMAGEGSSGDTVSFKSAAWYVVDLATGKLLQSSLHGIMQIKFRVRQVRVDLRIDSKAS